MSNWRRSTFLSVVILNWRFFFNRSNVYYLLASASWSSLASNNERLRRKWMDQPACWYIQVFLWCCHRSVEFPKLIGGISRLWTIAMPSRFALTKKGRAPNNSLKLKKRDEDWKNTNSLLTVTFSLPSSLWLIKACLSRSNKDVCRHLCWMMLDQQCWSMLDQKCWIIGWAVLDARLTMLVAP